ncbi:hypothetical protein ABWH89_21475 [Hoeflea alexandrii]|jgi:hypothetical protein|uniref:hypothetical protein n=1 Tax=Hoeflea alexandrii TaxID=288436 RepID=UPI0035CEB0B4
MEFTIGSIVFLSSMLVLALLARISAVNPQSRILRGEIVPAMLAVIISTGLAVGPLMMALGGEQYFASRSLEVAVILAFIVVSGWLITKLVARAPQSLPA